MKDLSDEVEGVHGSSEEYWQDDAWRCDQGLCGELPTSGRELHNSPAVVELQQPERLHISLQSYEVKTNRRRSRTTICNWSTGTIRYK